MTSSSIICMKHEMKQCRDWWTDLQTEIHGWLWVVLSTHQRWLVIELLIIHIYKTQDTLPGALSLLKCPLRSSLKTHTQKYNINIDIQYGQARQISGLLM